MEIQKIKQKLNRFIDMFLKRENSAELIENEHEEQHVMSMDEKIDESGKESFPASDPPAHSSFTGEIKDLH